MLIANTFIITRKQVIACRGIIIDYLLILSDEDLEQSIIIGLYKTETLLKYAPADIKRYLNPFLDQLNKLKELPAEHLSDENGGKSIIDLMDLCFISLTKNDIDTEELFAQLLCFTIKSVLLVKNHEKLMQSSAAGFIGYNYRNN